MAGQGASNGPSQAAGSQFVKFSRASAQRIARVVRQVEAGDRSQSGVVFDHPMPSQASRIRIGKTTSAWSKGASASITIYESGSAGSETTSSTTVTAWNKFAQVGSGKWVALARGPFGAWYLIAAEC